MPDPEATTVPPVLVGLDPEGPSEEAEALARTLARAYGADVVLGTVFPIINLRSRVQSRHYERLLREEAERFLAGRVDRWSAGGAGVAVRSVVTGSPSAARGLHVLARESEAGVVVVGPSRRHGAGLTFPGPMATRFAHGAPCPVAVALGGPAERLARIGVAFVPTDDGRAALTAAAALAERSDAILRVISVTGPLPWLDVVQPSFDGDALPELYAGHLAFELQSAVDGLPDGLVVETETPAGDPIEVLASASAGLDLLVCGSRGHGPLGEVVLGSRTHALLGAARCPVLVVPRAARGRGGPPHARESQSRSFSAYASGSTPPATARAASSA